MLRKIGKGIKRFMDDKMNMCKLVLSSDKNKLTVGLICIGVGAALVASIYIRVPNE